MKERETIIGVLRELGRRLWIARAIREAAFAGCVVLFCLICFQLIGPALEAVAPVVASTVRFALLAAFVIVAAEALARGALTVTPGQAAAEADSRAHLKDELKSAHWFLSQSATSPFANLQLRRAAVTAIGLDLRALAPRKLPGNALLAAGLALSLLSLTWMTPQLSRSWDAGGDSATAERGDPADLRALLKDAPQDAQVAKLDQALRKLQKAGASRDEKMRALADARDAIDQANMDASTAREAMAKLADALKTDPRLESATQAMKEGRTDAALAQLRQLKADDSGAESPTAVAADKGNAPVETEVAAAESTGVDSAGKRAVLNQDAIDRVINALEQANEQMEVQARVNSVKRRMESSLVVTSQRSQLTASQFDNRSNAPNATPAPATGDADLRGGTLFRQAAVAREEGDTAHEGSQTGDASGDSAALPLEGAPTRRLDAQLKLETITQKSDPGEQAQGKGDEGWFYSASREQKSTLVAREVRAPSGYDREGASSYDRVPVRQKNIVRDYFLNLNESENK
ncbi:MAG: hypothetical protein ABI648_02110 [Betaproteobacteria bacterium]